MFNLVPIYDGREWGGSHFLFRPSNLSILKLFPHYMESHDLDAFNLGAVGYSLGVWAGFNGQPRISTNVLFVIVLGSALPQKVLEARGLLA